MVLKIIKDVSIMVVCLCMSTMLSAQNFDGEYKSKKTSFRDESNASNSFMEETDFNIFIASKDENQDGLIAIQDPRIPDKTIIYSNIEYIGELKDDANVVHIYKGKPEHINQAEKDNISIYIDKDGNINLMLKGENSSQVFFDLIKIN